jgi:zinc transporter ZupT
MGGASALATGISIQDAPEGMVVAMALKPSLFSVRLCFVGDIVTAHFAGAL